MAELSEIIETYKKKRAEDPGNAVSFMPGEFQGPLAPVLNKRYVGLVMPDGYELGYDPVNRRIYHVDPDETSETFDPVMGQYILLRALNNPSIYGGQSPQEGFGGVLE